MVKQKKTKPAISTQKQVSEAVPTEPVIILAQITLGIDKSGHFIVEKNNTPRS